MSRPRTQNRALQLALEDWNVAGKRPDQEIAEEWGVTTKSVEAIRRTEEYTLLLTEIRSKTLSYVGDRAGRVQAAALGRLEETVELLADKVVHLLNQEEVTANNIKAVTPAIGLLYKIGMQSLPETQAEAGVGPAISMPHLRIAKSQTHVTMEFHRYPEEDVIEGEIVDTQDT